MLKANSQDIHFYLEVSPKHDHEYTIMMTSARWLHCHFYCSILIFWFRCQISDQREPLVALIIGCIWQPWGNLEPFWYSKLSNLRNQGFEEGCSDVQKRYRILWGCINFKEKTGVQHIYWIIDHNLIISTIISFMEGRYLIFQFCGSYSSQISIL